MDDPSTDVSSMERDEILTLLGLCNSKQNTAKLRSQLRKTIMEKHPIHEWLGSLANGDLKNFFKLIFPNCPLQSSQRMKTAIATFYFKRFPKSPLSALKSNFDGKFTSEKQTPLKTSLD